MARTIFDTIMSLDGFSSNSGRHPGFDAGTERGGRATPLFGDESLAYIGEYYQRANT